MFKDITPDDITQATLMILCLLGFAAFTFGHKELPVDKEKNISIIEHQDTRPHHLA